MNAGLGSSIDFDPATFPPGVLTSIAVTSALPAITRSGTTVDGSGAGVAIDGAVLGAGEDGLVFESGAGNALAKVTVRSIVVRSFPGNGVVVCGGTRSDCADPLSQTLVSHVTSIGNGGDGILIDGGDHGQAAVLDSYAEGNGGSGIRIYASRTSTRRW